MHALAQIWDDVYYFIQTADIIHVSGKFVFFKRNPTPDVNKFLGDIILNAGFSSDGERKL